MENQNQNGNMPDTSNYSSPPLAEAQLGMPQAVAPQPISAPVESQPVVVLPQASLLESEVVQQAPQPTLTAPQPIVSTSSSVATKKPHIGIKPLLLVVLAAFIILSAAVAVILFLANRESNQAQVPSLTVTEQDIDVNAGAAEGFAVLGATGTNSQLIVNGELVSQGSVHIGNNGTYGQLSASLLTANREYSLPDSSGVFCLDSNNCNYLLEQNAVTTALNGLTGQISLQGATDQIAISVNGSTINIAAPQNIGLNSSPTFASITLSGTGTQNGNTLCDSSNNCGAALGGGNFIQNGIAMQSTANFAIQSAASGNIGGVIRGAVGQTAALQEWQNSSGLTLLKVRADGGLEALDALKIYAEGQATPFIETDMLFGVTPVLAVNVDTQFSESLSVLGAASIGDLGGGPSVFISPTALRVSEEYDATQDCPFYCYGSHIAAKSTGVAANGVVALGLHTATGASGFTLGNAIGLQVTESTLGAGSTITNNYGILVSPKTVGTNDYGIAVGLADTQTLWLANTTADPTTSNAGIAFGSSRDTNLYRSAANVLRTDDVLSVGTLGATDNVSYLCYNSSSQLAACSGTSTGSAFIQGGNSFGGTAILGTNDNQGLDIETNGTTRLTVANTGAVSVTAALSVGTRLGIGTTNPTYDLSFGGETARTIKLETRTSNATGQNLTISGGDAGGGASPFAGGNLILSGGDAAGTGSANGGGVFIYGGNQLGSDQSINVALAHTGLARRGTVSIGMSNTGGSTSSGNAILAVQQYSDISTGATFRAFGNGLSSASILQARTNDNQIFFRVGNNSMGTVAIEGVTGQTADLINVTTKSGSSGDLLTLDINGNLSLGDVTPKAKLDVGGVTGTNIATIINNGTSTGDILNLRDNGTAVLRVVDGGAVTSQNTTNSTTAFVVKDSAGTSNVLSVDTTNQRVAIGNGLTAPTVTLDVLSAGADATTVAQFKNAGATSCTVQPGGTGFACSSDARLKTNVVTLDNVNSLDVINQLRGVSFNWINNPNGQSQSGFIAQELERLIPGAVSIDSNGFKVANYTAIIPYVVNAMQQQQGQINSDESRINALEQRLSNLDSASVLQPSGHQNFASLNVSGMASAHDLTVTGVASVAQLNVSGNALFNGDITVNGHITGNEDTRGLVTVVAGQKEAKHIFRKAYSSDPYVVITAKDGFTPSYRVEADRLGFTVYFKEVADQSISLNYLVQQ